MLISILPRLVSCSNRIEHTERVIKDSYVWNGYEIVSAKSTSFEDAIRNAVSLNGDSDTIAAIAGSIAEAYYGIPEEIKQQALPYVPEPLLEIIKDFYGRYKYMDKRKGAI